MKLRFDIFILLLLLVLFPVTAFASTWARSYGGSGYDDAISIQQTTDGGFIAAGLTDSFGAGSRDAWVLKLDVNGDIPDCDIIHDTSLVENNTSVILTSAEFMVRDSDATVTSQLFEPMKTDAFEEILCYSELSPHNVDMVIEKVRIDMKKGKFMIEWNLDVANPAFDNLIENPQFRTMLELQTGGTENDPEVGIVSEDQVPLTSGNKKLQY